LPGLTIGLDITIRSTGDITEGLPMIPSTGVETGVCPSVSAGAGVPVSVGAGGILITDTPPIGAATGVVPGVDTGVTIGVGRAILIIR